ncbi:MAG: GDP-mannose 4,6-dehydratase [Verrucomicrobiia bacterium]
MHTPILVIGSNSISGAFFIRHCLRAGHQVIGFSRSPELAPCFLPYRWLESTALARFSFEQMDLNHHLDHFLNHAEATRAELVVNFAAQSMVAESWANPDHWYQTNVVANVRLHEGLRKLPSLKKYVHISTPEVYGSCSGNVTEDQPFNPSTPYAASRAAADLHLMTFFKQYHFPVVFTRAANVYGPGQQLYRIIPRTILAVLLGEKLQLHGGGHSVRAFIHLDDVADATYRVMQQGQPGQAYHISTDRFISIRDLVMMICERMGASFEACVDIVGDRPGKDAAYLLDSTRCRRDLGWTDTVSLEQGIDEVIAWARQWLAEIQKHPLRYIHKP